MDVIETIEKEQMRKDLPVLDIGDYIKVHLKIKEGSRERIQIFEGTLIARKGKGLKETITVRRISYGIGVERILLLHSPKIDHIQIVRKGKVRRAKLYYLRKRIGKSAKVREKLGAKVRMEYEDKIEESRNETQNTEVEMTDTSEAGKNSDAVKTDLEA
jgi:large subunit ribosomal protein L19